MLASFALLFLLLTVPASAQMPDGSAVPAAVIIDVLPAVGDKDVVGPVPNGSRSTPIGATAGNCNLVPDPTTQFCPTPCENPTATRFTDPWHSGRECQAPLPIGVAAGSGYRAVASFLSNECMVNGQAMSCVGARSAVGIPPFAVVTQNPCDPDAQGRPAVRLNVGDWTRSALRSNSGRVLYSLTQSRHPVIRVIVNLGGVEQDRLEGVDLRKVAGSYFVLPNVAGSYMLSVSAIDNAGCEDGVARPMTVIVQ